MKKYLVAFLLLSGAAQADSSYVPYEIGEPDARAVGDMLGEIPAKYALPLISFFQRKEQIAAGEKAAKEAPKTKEAPAPKADK